MRENPIETYFCNEVKKAGGKAYKWVSPGNDGVPDRIVFLKGCAFLVELKATRGRLRAAQKVQKKQLSKLGFEVVVINSKEQAKLWVHLQAATLERLARAADWQEGRTGFERFM